MTLALQQQILDFPDAPELLFLLNQVVQFTALFIFGAINLNQIVKWLVWRRRQKLYEVSGLSFLIDVLIQRDHHWLFRILYNYWLLFALHFHVNDELAACSDLALDRYSAAHLLNDLFADWQTQACAALVAALFVVQLAKVHEQVAEVILVDANAGVSDGKLHMDKFQRICFLLSNHFSWLFFHQILDLLSIIDLIDNFFCNLF